MALYPLQFKPVYRSVLWGGDDIAKRYHRDGVPLPCGESWEISGLPSDSTVVSNGFLAGRTLADITEEYREALTGTLAPDYSKFPLLFKILNSAEQLSIQVHPTEKSVPITGGNPKDEMWYVLAREPNAKLFAGFKPGITHEKLVQSIDSGCVSECVHEIAPNPGEVVSIPAGLIHSIGGGYLIYEVQQSSDTTYRFYDWDRVDKKTGKKRELHIEKSLQSINWSLGAAKIIPAVVHSKNCNSYSETSKHSAFKFFSVNVLEPQIFAGTPETFHVIFMDEGACSLESCGMTISLSPGSSVLIPAQISFRLCPSPHAHFLMTTL